MLVIDRLGMNIILYCTFTTEVPDLIHDLVGQEVACEPALARGAEGTPHGAADLRMGPEVGS